MKLILAMLLGVLPACVQAAVPLAWSGGTALGGGGNDLVRGVASDRNGYAYLVGSFEGTAQFGTTNLTSAGQQDAFVAKFSPNGGVVWARRMGGTAIDWAQAVAVDGAGNTYVCGAFYGAAAFGSTNLTPVVGADAYLVRLSSDGEVVWVRQISGGSDDFANALAISPGGGVYMGGSFTGSASVSGTQLSGGNGRSMFLAQFDATGQVVWATQVAGDGSQVVTPRAMVVDVNTNLYVAGEFLGAAIFSVQPPAPLTSAGGGDAFLARYASDGTLLWARSGGGSGDDSAYGVTIFTNGAVYVCGGFQQSAQFGSTNVSAVATNDFYVAKYSNAGDTLWVRTGTNGNGTAMAVSSSGSLFAAGHFDGANGNFSLGSFFITGTSGVTNSFLAELAEDGTPQNLIALHGGPSALAVSAASGLEDSILVGGYLTGNLSMATHTLAGPGNGANLDGFVLRLAPPPFRIRMERTVNGLHLAWPSVYSNATVETTAQLGNPGSWTGVVGAPSPDGDSLILPLIPDQPHQFFRLHR